MSKGGADTQTVTQTLDPEIKAAYLGNLDYSRDVANQLGVRQFAGFDPLYQQGEAQARTVPGGLGAQNIGTAANLTRAAAGYAPSKVAADPTAIQSYMNPYTQKVIDTTLGDIERQRQMQINQMGAQAQAARAFGGSRHGVAEAETNLGFGRQSAQTAANLRHAGFQQAAQQAQEAAIRNQTAGLQGAQLRGDMAAQLGRLGGAQQQANLLGARSLMDLGLSRQALAQRQLDAARGLGQERLGIMRGSLGLLGSPTAGAGQSTTASSEPGLFDYLTLGTTIAGIPGVL